MINALKTRIRESDRPVGTKRPNLIKLPPEGHVYGLEGRKDPEGVGTIIRSWKVHHPSRTAQPPQDFITINKLAIKMNATNFGTNKDFRKTVDIRKKVRHGKIERKIYLPPEEFAYGLPNRPPTPFKDVIYNAYGNRAEDIIRNEYGNYIRERSVKNMRPPEVITRYINPKAEEYKLRDLEKKNGGLTTYNAFDQDQEKNEKPLYKLKMFQDVGSKVAEEVKLFKTYHPYRKKKKVDDGVDYLINKVQGEIEQNNKQKLDEPMNNLQPMEQNFNLNQNGVNNNSNEMQPMPEAVHQ
jgi:hypothetical protein